MEPDWNEAPEWANYWAMDENGETYWYKSKPVRKIIDWSSRDYMRKDRNSAVPIWKESLRKRP